LKVLGIIPARFSSSRFPGKPLIDLKGKSMIQRVYEGAQKSTMITDLVVATDDQRIIEEVKRFNGNVVLTSSFHTTGTDRCGEVLQQYSEIDVVVNIQGDEPLVDYRQIDALLKSFENPIVQIATLGIKDISKHDLENSNRIKIVVNHENKALYFSRSAIPNFANFIENAIDFYPFLRHIGLYAYRSTILKEIVELKPCKLEKIESLEQLRWLYYNYSIHVVETDIETPNIDVPEDVEKVIKFL
jgi:3-deoxy-manno-octulosonate cytidylyltransferase (CMP-KDO synthetase)